jgi:hypothetical protein
MDATLANQLSLGCIPKFIVGACRLELFEIVNLGPRITRVIC